MLCGRIFNIKRCRDQEELVKVFKEHIFEWMQNATVQIANNCKLVIQT